MLQRKEVHLIVKKLDCIMTQGPNRIFDDFAKLMTDAAGAAQGLRKEAETAFRNQADRFLADMDLVKREDFDAIQELASKARIENEALSARIDALEKRLDAVEKGGRSAAKPKTTKSAAKKST